MSLTTQIDYDTPGDFTYDNTKIDVTTVAALKLMANPSQLFSQAFTTDTGFTYDNTKSEFTGGLVRQKDQRPANATFGATYTSTINGSWGNGVLTGTATGGASVISGKLDCTGATKFIQYIATGNADSTQSGCVRLRVTPNYSGSPAATRYLFAIAKSSSDYTNLIALYHTSAGALGLVAKDSSGAILINSVSMGTWIPVAGVEYEFELNWDFTIGATRVFINKTQFGITRGETGIRGGIIGIFNLGAYYDGTLKGDFYFNDVEVFSAVQHTANYTGEPSYSVPEYSYLATLISLPQFAYSGAGALQALTNFTTTEVDSPRYVLNDKYYSGGWIASDGSYAQATIKANILTNIATFPDSDTLDIDIVFDNSNILGSVDQLDVTYTGQIYSSDSPKITVNAGLGMTSLLDFDVIETKPTGTEIKYTGKYQGNEYYISGGVFTLSDGTYAQTSTAAEIFAALPLDISPDSTVQLIAHLKSDGTATPELTSVSLEYNYYATPITINKCAVFGRLLDFDGIDNDGIGVSGATITFKSKTYTSFDSIDSINASAVTNSEGYFVVYLPTTQAKSVAVTIESSWVDSKGITQKIKLKKYIPDQETCSVEDLPAA